MYFSPEIQERILGNFHFALRPGGVLVGKAEALQEGRKLFEPFDLKRRIFVKDGSVEPGFRLPRLAFGHEAPRADEGDLGEVAFEHAPVAQIVLDSDLGIASINQTARVLFALKLGDVGRRLQDLDVSYRPIELSSLIADRDRNERASLHGTSSGGVPAEASDSSRFRSRRCSVPTAFQGSALPSPTSRRTGHSRPISSAPAVSSRRRPDVQLEGHNRRGQAVAYTVQFDPLRSGGVDGAITGVILTLTTHRH